MNPTFATSCRNSGKTLAPISLIALYWLALYSSIVGVPLAPSAYTEYVYNYDTSIALGGGSDDHSASLSPPSGLRFQAKAHLELVYTIDDNNGDTTISSQQQQQQQQAHTTTTSQQIVRLRVSEPIFYSAPNAQSLPLVTNLKHNKLHNPQHDLYAHIVMLNNGTAQVKQVYTHQADAQTFRNIKKSILLNLLPTTHHLTSSEGSTSTTTHFQDDNSNAQPELFSPDSISKVKIYAKVKRSPGSTTSRSNEIPSSSSSSSEAPTRQAKARIVFERVEGHQNVTFRSRVFNDAQSQLATKFELNLVEEVESKAHEKFDHANSIQQALALLDSAVYAPDTVELRRERKMCTVHHCGRNLKQLCKDYETSLTEHSLASVDASVAYLRVLDRLRDARGSSADECLAVLKRMPDDVASSFLDILAGARTRDSIAAAFKFLKLPKNKDLDMGERFLSALSVVAKTTSKMHAQRKLNSPYYMTPTSALKMAPEARAQRAKTASLDYIAELLLKHIEAKQKWSSEKLRWSTLLTLATVTSAHNTLLADNDATDNTDLITRVNKLMLKELNACAKYDVDCRIVALQAIGNIGYLGDEQFAVLRESVLHSGHRESIVAMRVLRDLLQAQPKDMTSMPDEFYALLKDLLMRVVYDGSQETTARVLAAELLVRFVPNSLEASRQLLHHLASFQNNELATMIYSRLQSLHGDEFEARHHENWYWKSSIINGTSASFQRTMARTESLNASYGVNVELLNNIKVLRESSFDVVLDTKQRTQDLFSLGIFARGLASLAGASGDDAHSDKEDATAGMTLRILGGYLRPYIFFTSQGQLFGHVWSGTASEPTPVFNNNLLLIDHEEGYPLISGFVAEQQMRGVLSIDVQGQVSVSIWYKTSHSKVRTSASVLVQASQSIYTSYDNYYHSDLFSFGGQALIDFVTDAAKRDEQMICMQVSQPEFMVRYNSRKHKQLMTKHISRTITRRNFMISSKSYSLNSENNKMCLAMHADGHLAATTDDL